MPDQAAELRRMVGQSSSPYAKVLTFASGKGGVGKTNIIMNIAIELAGRDLKIALLDMDLGLANIDILLGMTSHHNLSHVMGGQKKITDIILPGPNDIMFIPGASGVSRLANLKEAERTTLIESFAELQLRADLLLIDTGAGIGDNVLQFALSSQALIVVTTPEPTARMDAYALIKSIHREGSGVLPVFVIVNQVKNQAEAEQVHGNLSAVCMKHLSYNPSLLGYIPSDQAVPKSVKERRPFLLQSPGCPASRAIKRLSTELQRIFLPDRNPGERRVKESFFSRVFSLFSGKAKR